MHPPQFGAGASSPLESDLSNGAGSGSGCFNDGGLLYRVQAERECREGPGKYVRFAPRVNF